MQKRFRFISLFAFILAAALAASGCGGGGGSGGSQTIAPQPTPYEMVVAAIAAADTAEDAQAAYDAVKDDVTAAEGEKLQAVVNARVDALMAMAREADQKSALMTAAGMVNTSDLTTAEAIAAAKTAIAALQTELVAAADVSDADKAMYQGLSDAAQSAIDHADQTMALTDAVGALQAIDLSGLSDQEAIDAAVAAIAALRTALGNATDLTDAQKSAAMIELATASRIVMAARGRTDTEGQEMALSDAVAALGNIDLSNLTTQAQIDAAEKAIIALDLVLKAATNLTDAQKIDATVDVTVAKRRVMAAKEVLAANIEGQKEVLTTAAAALGEIDLGDLDTPEKIAAANGAVNALKAALAVATHLSDAAKVMYRNQLDAATETVRMAQTGMDREGRMTAQRADLMNTVTMAQTAVAGVNDKSTDSEVAAADAAVKAVKDAIVVAEDLSEGDAAIISAKAVLGVIEPQLAAAKTSRMAAMDAAGKKQSVALAKTGKAMHAALAGPTMDMTALDNTTTAILSESEEGLVVVAHDTAAGLTINPMPGALKAGDSAGALGSWMGMNYANTNAGTEARVYTNRGPGKRISFAKTDHVLTAQGVVEVNEEAPALVMAAAFTHSGTQSHPILDDNLKALKVRGTYDGAPGEYSCTGVDVCTSTNDGTGSPSALGGTWTFKPDTGAMVSRPDADYLYYGWWVSKDKDGMPTAASAFTGKFGSSDALLANGWVGDKPLTLTGSATYAGHAAGKFALTNPLDGTGDGGHFTADATLNAKFSGEMDVGITGMIDNFMANDKSVPWSVSLGLGTWGSGGAITAPAPPEVSTVWSINGNKALASGTWSGQMYDEKPGDAPGGGDGSNIPTTVTGTFYSEFSSIGRMVGAFGANKQ